MKLKVPGAPKPRHSQRWWSGNVFLISVLLHVLFAVAAGIWVVSSYVTKRETKFTGPPPTPNPSSRVLEHRVQSAKKQGGSSAPAQARRIVSTSGAKVALPDMPAMPRLSETTASRMGGMGGMGMGMGAGFGTGSGIGGGGGGGGGGIPFFGLRTLKGGGMVGYLYDIKQDRNGKFLGKDTKKFGDVINELMNRDFADSAVNPYYKAEKPLYLSHLLVPHISADEGPKAFQVQGKVQPSCWLALYEGMVSPPLNGTYRFVGAADDKLVVRFNGKIVLDAGGWQRAGINTGHYLYNWTTANKFYANNKGHSIGQPMNLKAGQWYRMQILIGEQPGGQVYFSLFVQDDSKLASYRKDKNGHPLLPLWRLSADLPKDHRMNPEYEKEGPIWRVQAAGGGNPLDFVKKPGDAP